MEGTAVSFTSIPRSHHFLLLGNNCERLPHLQTASEAGGQACEPLEVIEDLIHSLPVKEKSLCLASRLADLMVRLSLFLYSLFWNEVYAESGLFLV